MKASRGVTRPRRPHSEAIVSSAFKMFSVAVSSVLKRRDKMGEQREWKHIWTNSKCFQFMGNSFSTAWFPKVCIQHDWWKSSYWKESPLTSRLVAETEQPIDHTSRHWPSPPTPGGLLRKNHKAFLSLFRMHFTSVQIVWEKEQNRSPFWTSYLERYMTQKHNTGHQGSWTCYHANPDGFHCHAV